MAPNNDFFMGPTGTGLWKTAAFWRQPSLGGVSAAFGRPGRYNDAVAFVIREYQADDFETLWRMDQECFSPGIAYSRQELKEYVRHRGSFTLVASDAETSRVAGFIVAHQAPTGHLITIDVIAEARRSGVGSLLLRAAEDRLRAAGSKAVGLETAVDNLAALSFYKRHGYSVVRTWPRYYSNGVDALVMKKELTA
jgi:[ribosomal protein S18]-alanine N-acetyltransferase